MTGKFSIPKTQADPRHPSAVSGLNRFRQARRLRRVRPLLDPLEERCLLNFGSPSLFDTGVGPNIAAVAIGDVNGDGIPDLVTATTTGGLSISQGKGDGTFLTPVMVSITPPAGTPLPTSFSAVKLVDLDGRIRPNGTPILDIVAADPAQDELWVLMNDGNGAFATKAYPTTVVSLPSGSDPVAMAVADATPDFIDSSTIDFNGDTTTNLLGNTAGNNAGHLKYAADIVIANPAGNNVIVLLGNGDGTFQTPVPYPVGNVPVAVALGDFNNDGFPDIITANQTGNSVSSVSVLLNNGNGLGTFRPRMDIPITVPRPQGSQSTLSSKPVGIAVGDFNGDGNLDFVTANSGWPSVNVVLGNGDGSFGTQQTISTLTYTPTAVVAADLDGNGFVDIALTEPGNNSIGVLYGNGDGTFDARVDYPAGESPAALVTGNLKGDQTSLKNDRLDLVAVDTNPQLSQVSILLGQKYTTTMALDPAVSTIWGGSVGVTPVVNSAYVSQPMPLTGSYQLYLDKMLYGVPQPLSSTFELTKLAAGQHKLWAVFTGDDDYDVSTTSTSTITVLPAELTVTALGYSRAYGADDSGVTFGYSITGFVNGDVEDKSDVSGKVNYTHNDGTDSPTEVKQPVGNYAIHISQFVGDRLTYLNPNYVIDPTFNPGILTITPAPLTITASNQSPTKGYGFDTPNAGPKAALGTTAFTPTGQLFNGDWVASVTLSTNDTLSSSSHYNAGTWTITPSAASFSPGSSSSNYAITYVNASIGLTVAPLVIGATATLAYSSKIYDGTTAGPPISVDSLDKSKLLSNSAGTVSVSDQVSLVRGSATFADPNVGTNKVVNFSGYTLSGADAADYALSQQPASITTATINQATLVITAGSPTLNYGFGGTSRHAPLGATAFTALVELNNDPTNVVPMYGSDAVTVVTLSTNAKLSSSSNFNANTTSNPHWTITPSLATGIGLGNYLISPTTGYISGLLTISPKALTVTADNKSRAYGVADVSFTDSITGFVKGEVYDPSKAQGKLEFTPPDVDSRVVGNYAINISQPVVGGADYVTPGPLTYTDTNYTINPTLFVPGTLTITPAPLTITASNQSPTKGYGFDTPNAGPKAALGTTAFTPTGQLFNGDWVASVTLSTNDTLSSSSHYNAGTWTITPSAASFSPGSSSSNYAITYVNASIGLTVAPLVIGATATLAYSSKIYDGTTAGPPISVDSLDKSKLLSNSAGTVSVSDQVSLVRGSATFADPNVGTNKVVNFSGYTLSGADAADYALSQPTSTDTTDITAASLTITAGTQNVTYGFGGTSAALGTTAYTITTGKLYGSDSLSVTLSTSALLSSSSYYDAGSWPITPSVASGSGLGNYNISCPTVAGALVVSPKALTVTALATSRVYGAADPTSSAWPYSISGFVNGDYYDPSKVNGALTPTFTSSDTSLTSPPVGTYSIAVASLGSLGWNYPAANPNYVFALAHCVPGKLTITPALLTVTANPAASHTYGQATNFAVTDYAISGLINPDTISVTLTSAGAAAGALVAGSPYAIVPSVLVSDPSNYTIVYVNGQLTVNKAPLTITANPQSKTYGAADPALTYQSSGFQLHDTQASAVTGALSRAAGEHVAGGPYVINEGTLAAANYTIAFTGNTLTITPALLTITANGQTKVYGAAMPTLTASYIGLVNGDTAASLSTQPTLRSTANAQSAVSAAGYTITASGAVDGDYNINSTSYVPGTLTVTPAILTLTADNKSRAYGVGDPSLTYSISGFVNGDFYDPSKVNGAGTPVFTSSDTMLSSPPVGTYSIAVASLGSLGWNYPTANPNYVFDLAHCVPGILTITPALLTVTANPAASHTYGQATNFAVTDYAISGLVNPDTISVTLTSAGAAAGALVAGSPYAIVPSAAVSDPSNYTIVYVNGQLTVNKAPLTITANPQSKTYGAADPALTYQSSGFQLHDTQASAVTGALSRAAGEHVAGGPYVINEGTLAAANYTIAFTGNTLTITPALLTITANGQTKVYGAAMPTLTASYIGLVNGDTAASLSTQPTLRSTANAQSAVSAAGYTITASGAVDGDYNINSTSYVPGTLTVTPAILTLTADNKSRAYGAADPSLTDSISGFVNGDFLDSSELQNAPTFASTDTGPSPVGNYTIGISPGSLIWTYPTVANPNYVFDSDLAHCVPGKLTITPALLTVTAEPASYTYGLTNFAVTAYATSGLINPDTVSVTETSAGAAAGASVAGSPYAIVPSAAVSDPSNYTIVYVNGQLTVNKAPLTITANPKSKTYGAADPTFTDTISGFINGQTLATSGVTGAPSFTTTADTTSHVGTYNVVAGISSLQSGDYLFSFMPGTLTITPAPLTIMANNTSQPFGTTPSLSASFIGLVNGDTAASLAAPAVLSTTATGTSLPGTYPITVSGASSADYSITYNSGTFTVQQSSTVSSLEGPILRSSVTSPVTFTVDVRSSSPGSIPSTGIVAFYDQAQMIGTAPVVNGIATLTTSALAKGNYMVHAVYQGDTNYEQSSTGTITQIVMSTAPTAPVKHATPIPAHPKKATPKPKAPAPKPKAHPVVKPKAPAPKPKAHPVVKPKAPAPKPKAHPVVKPKAPAPKPKAHPVVKPKAPAPKPKAHPVVKPKAHPATKPPAAVPVKTPVKPAVVRTKR